LSLSPLQLSYNMTLFQENKFINAEFDKQELDEEKEKIIRDKYKSNPEFKKRLDALLDVWIGK